MKNEIKRIANQLSKGIKRFQKFGNDSKTIKNRFFQILDFEVSQFNFENEMAKETFKSLVKIELFWLDNESYRVVFPKVEYK